MFLKVWGISFDNCYREKQLLKKCKNWIDKWFSGISFSDIFFMHILDIWDV